MTDISPLSVQILFSVPGHSPPNLERKEVKHWDAVVAERVTRLGFREEEAAAGRDCSPEREMRSGCSSEVPAATGTSSLACMRRTS